MEIQISHSVRKALALCSHKRFATRIMASAQASTIQLRMGDLSGRDFRFEFLTSVVRLFVWKLEAMPYPVTHKERQWRRLRKQIGSS